MSTQTRQPAGVPVGGQFAATTRDESGVQLPVPTPPLQCDECGEPMTVDQTGVSNHVDEDGNVDHVADGEHVAYTPEDDPADVSAWPERDLAPCVRDGEHHRSQRHPFAECPTAGDERETEVTAAEEQLAELTEEAQDEYNEAFEYAQDCKADADDASILGTRQEKDMTLALEAGAKAALELADRRRTALALATDPTAGRPEYADYANPRTLTEVRRTVKDAKAGKVHGILLRNEATSKLDGRLEIAGPKDGTPLYVDICSGFSPLRVTSGTVVVNARSAMGNGIDVGPDATVVVIADPGRKVSTTVEGGVAVVVGAQDARGLQFNRGGVLDVVGAAPGMTVRGATA